MQIPWRIKSSAFSVIDTFRLQGLLYWCQKNVTGRSRIDFAQPSEDWGFHEGVLKGLGLPAVIEFGAGKSLAQNIYLSPVCASQTLVDLFPMFDANLAGQAAARIAEMTGRQAKPIGNLDDLEAYGIRYMAPLDVAASPFADGTFDACISTNTLEHIPEADIRRILKELRRILKRGGTLSALIDYSDHYAHTDLSISALEYLRYTDEEYARFNHRCHYQNRLRHSDHCGLFEEAGFEFVQAEAFNFKDPPSEIRYCDDYASDPTFAATRGRFVLRNV